MELFSKGGICETAEASEATLSVAEHMAPQMALADPQLAPSTLAVCGETDKVGDDDEKSVTTHTTSDICPY